MPYKPRPKADSHRRAEEYANQQYTPSSNRSRRSDYTAVEEYRAKYVPINPDSDAPDPEAMVPERNETEKR